MPQFNAGTRIKSAVCSSELMVIAAPKSDIDLRCGGAAVIDMGADAAGEIDPQFKDGCALGKRYVSENGDVELLCTKPGEGSLSIGDVGLTIKEAKPLPSSD